MTVSIISLVLEQDANNNDIMVGWQITKTEYKEFSLGLTGQIKYLESFKKEDYTSLLHFTGVMGKFDPFTKFFNPVQADDLSFASLLPLLKGGPK